MLGDYLPHRSIVNFSFPSLSLLCCCLTVEGFFGDFVPLVSTPNNSAESWHPSELIAFEIFWTVYRVPRWSQISELRCQLTDVTTRENNTSISLLPCLPHFPLPTSFLFTHFPPSLSVIYISGCTFLFVYISFYISLFAPLSLYLALYKWICLSSYSYIYSPVCHLFRPSI